MLDRNWDEIEVALVCQELRLKLGKFDRIWDRSWVFDSNWDRMFGIPTGSWSTLLRYYAYIYVKGMRKRFPLTNKIPFTVWGFHLQFADSTHSVRIPLTVAVSATAQFNNIHVSLFVCGFHNWSGIRKYGCGFHKFAYFWSNFERYSVVGIC